MDFYESVVRHMSDNATVKMPMPSNASAAGVAAGRVTPRKGDARRPAWPMPYEPRSVT